MIKVPRIPQEQWSEVALRVTAEGLRAVARDFDVPHEAVRSICKRVRQPATVP